MTVIFLHLIFPQTLLQTALILYEIVRTNKFKKPKNNNQKTNVYFIEL